MKTTSGKALQMIDGGGRVVSTGPELLATRQRVGVFCGGGHTVLLPLMLS